jgi:hypothetical protein
LRTLGYKGGQSPRRLSRLRREGRSLTRSRFPARLELSRWGYGIHRSPYLVAPSSPLWGGPTRPKAEREGGRRAWSTLPTRDGKSLSRRGRAWRIAWVCPCGWCTAGRLRQTALCPAPPSSLGLRPSRSSPTRGEGNCAPALCESASPFGRGSRCGARVMRSDDAMMRIIVGMLRIIVGSSLRAAHHHPHG